MRKLVIHQPNFLPRLKTIQKIFKADIWCVLDHVQYSQREWQNRAKLYNTSTNRKFWITIPVSKPNGSHSKIENVRIINPQFQFKKIKKTLLHTYGKSCNQKVLDEILFCKVEEYKEPIRLMDFCVDTTVNLFKALNKDIEIVYSSQFNQTFKSSELIASLCKQFDNVIYLSDSGGYSYMKQNHFNDIDILWQEWKEPNVDIGNDFMWRDLSYINYLMNFGINELKNYLEEDSFRKFDSWDLINIY